jgi:hypothetical protein
MGRYVPISFQLRGQCHIYYLNLNEHLEMEGEYVTSPFLFSKSTIEAQHLPSPSVHYGSGNKYVTSPFLFSKSTIEAQHLPSPSVHYGSNIFIT